MSSYIFPDLAIAQPQILIPNKHVDLSLWPVIACDQFTSEPEYWEETGRITENVCSTLHLILPEVYLESLSPSSLDAKIDAVNRSMRSYLTDNTLVSLPEGFILLDRSTSLHPSRKGLILAVDLEQYDFTPGNKSLIRATEGTVLSRIPPRVRIRRDAPVEVPHIMILIDDPDHIVIDKAFYALKGAGREPVYDIDLMQGGGHITGYYAGADSSEASGIIDGLRQLLKKSSDGFLFAVGDGNHSLATAKAHWESIRSTLSEDERLSHPARFALVEIVNIHDDGLDFEPIHRIAFGLPAERFYASAGRFFSEQGFHFYTRREYESADRSPGEAAQIFPIISGRESYVMTLSRPSHSLAVGSLQSYLDQLSASDPSVRIDYIHGEDSVRSLAMEGNTGFLLPAITKDSFFATISREGVFPRKTFSMGEAFEKRYYMESKKIII
jgi:hypothetical protein